MKLVRGMGSFSVRKNGTIMFRKTIDGIRYTTTGKSEKEAYDKMAIREQKILSHEIPPRKVRRVTKQQKLYSQRSLTINQLLDDWLNIYKKPKLKKTSFDRLCKDARLYIREPIGEMLYRDVDSDMIQQILNRYTFEQQYVFTTVRNIYNVFHGFYNWMTKRFQLQENPMDLVELPNKDLFRKGKKIEALSLEDIPKFIHEATNDTYQYGYVLAANIFMGLRAGELLALKWEDIDFENNQVVIDKNLQRINNDRYGKYENENKTVFHEQGIKNGKSRIISLSNKAKEILLEWKTKDLYTSPADYVCHTRDGYHAAVSYLGKNVKQIEKNAGTTLQHSGTHSIRHTCASLMFYADMNENFIAEHLGHSVEVCRKTYIHFYQQQRTQEFDKFNHIQTKFSFDTI